MTSASAPLPFLPSPFGVEAWGFVPTNKTSKQIGPLGPGTSPLIFPTFAFDLDQPSSL